MATHHKAYLAFPCEKRYFFPGRSVPLGKHLPPSPKALRLFFPLIVVLVLCSPVLSGQPIVVRPSLEPVTPRWEVLRKERLKRPTVAIVLSGGGARGMAQIGVLKVLEQHGIPVDFIAATSLGAVVGGLYASGYTVAELESVAIFTDWDEVLSLTGDTRRTEMVVEDKLASDRSFLSLRFEGLEPVLPVAVSSGQRLTNFLNTLTLQSVYHPERSFDDLKITFRAVSTDLISGQRIVIRDGSLAEALRASSTVPLLFNPVEKDSLRLIDGGLVSNIPVDVARDEGYDIVIAVNTTSGMRREEELKAPWQTADQIMGIMMQLANSQQLARADIVVTPDLGRHLSSDFSGLNDMMFEGERATLEMIGQIQALYDSAVNAKSTDVDQPFPTTVIERTGAWPDDSLWQDIWQSASSGTHSMADVRQHVEKIFSTGMVADVYAEVDTTQYTARVKYHIYPTPDLKSVHFSGNSLLTEEALAGQFSGMLGKPVMEAKVISALENILRLYRNEGYSLARVEDARLDRETGNLEGVINEGIIESISIQGAERTREYVIRREFPLQEGDVFEIEKVRRGVANINGTNLFEYVYLEITYPTKLPVLTIRLKERPSQRLSLGLRSDNERNLQGLLDLRDDNLGGSGASLGITISGGSRNQEYVLEHLMHRLFDTYLTFNAFLFYRVFDSYLYADAPMTEPGRWERANTGEYRDIHYGGKVSFGAQLQKIGNTTVEFSLQEAKIKSKESAEFLAHRYRLARVRFGTVVDSKDSYPFPTSGIGVDLSYEFAFERFGSEVSYNALHVVYESYTTWRGEHTFRPKLTVGFADKTMPFGEQFRLGGRESMLGTREDDRRGRQLLLLNFEYRWKTPVKILFDTYLRVRYDLGTISEIPEQIKLSAFRHGIGAEIALDTPVGPGIVGLGKSFFFLNASNDHPIQQGPVLFYFMIGYQL